MCALAPYFPRISVWAATRTRTASSRQESQFSSLVAIGMSPSGVTCAMARDEDGLVVQRLAYPPLVFNWSHGTEKERERGALVMYPISVSGGAAHGIII